MSTSESERILLNVDDDEAGRYVKSRILKRAGYQVIESATGADALRLVKEIQPSLVLLDVRLPDMNGLDVCQAIKADPQTADVMVLQISATYITAADRASGLEQGADTYLSEPVEAAELLGIVRALLRLHDRDKEKRDLLEQLAEANRQQEAQLEEIQSIYATAPVGLAVIDTDMRYVRINDRLAEKNGLPAQQHIGRTVREMVPGIAPVIERLCREVIETGKPRLKVEIIGETAAQPGVQRTWLHSYTPIRHADGTCIGVNAVVEDLTDRKRLEQRLRDADKHKNEFLAVLGHELRNPLGVISNAFQLLPSSATAESQEIRDILSRQIKQMARLTDDLLDVSRIARGEITLKKEACDLAAIVRNAAEDYRGVLTSNRLSLELHVPDDPVWVSGDSTRLAQSVNNVLHNANKFTEPGGTVTVRLQTVGQEIAVLTVRDTGIGMDQDSLARAFEPFRQAFRTMDHGRPGLGLGLALVKGLIEAQGGEVSAKSRGLGHGSEFTIQLPIQKACDEPADRQVGETIISACDERQSCRVLIIDDNRIGARAMQIFLNEAGHEVEITDNGADGLVLARTFNPVVVICDIALPGMDGYAIARTIRHELALKDAYLIAISGYAQDVDQDQARGAEFDEYLLKPIDLTELEALIQKKLAQAPA